MRIFKRFGLYVLSIVLVVAAVSAAFIVPWIHTPTDFHDQALRGKLAGTIDTLIIGQSYSMDGIMPEIACHVCQGSIQQLCIDFCLAK